MLTPLIFLLFPALIYARIQLEIDASSDVESSRVRAYGSSVDIISDEERRTFRLNDETLKDSVMSYFGGRPDDAYLRSPTPFGDLYSSYNWNQVQRTLEPRKIHILSLTSQPSIVATHIFENNSTMTGEYRAGISQSVQNSFSNSYDYNERLTVGQDIEYGVNFEVANVGGKTTFQFTSEWGKSTTKAETVTVGSDSAVTITLEPGQKVIAELFTTRSTMKIQVDYEASLSGIVAVNYADTFKGHHFWSLDVNAVMKAGGLPNTVRAREVIELSYYSDSKVVIRDLKSNKVMYSIPVRF